MDVEVCVVTFDATPIALAYVRQTKLTWPLLLDTTRELYRAYQMERGGWWAIYGPASIWHYLKLIARGRRVQKPGSDWRQVGGDVLIDPQGIVRIHFVSASPHDRPTVDSVLSVVKRSSSF